jgi:hypothetical protein
MATKHEIKIMDTEARERLVRQIKPFIEKLEALAAEQNPGLSKEFCRRLVYDALTYAADDIWQRR